ncbi:hypothetical protein DdX_22111 [Ditylenchus destructor]|uniref:Uncharacterized protein n=1 Tax=Ditylenchus destructor TaxID=166010 RepID=A0AAD4MI17_9BILA|nr:hypothetical protein DdX_22111 [Ditylenchus destructor]
MTNHCGKSPPSSQAIARAEYQQRPDRGAMRTWPARCVVGGKGDGGDTAEHGECQVPTELCLATRCHAQQRWQPACGTADQGKARAARRSARAGRERRS